MTLTFIFQVFELSLDIHGNASIAESFRLKVDAARQGQGAGYRHSNHKLELLNEALKAPPAKLPVSEMWTQEENPQTGLSITANILIYY